MLRALWFILKVTLLIGIAVWLAGQKGSIQLHWLDYKIDMALGLFLAGLFVVMLAALSLYRLLRAIADIPAIFARKRQLSRRDKAYQSLTRGLSAVAAGDARMAVKMSRRVRGLIHDHSGLPLLLEAQAAQLEGKEDEALALFLQLSQSKDAGFLGIRGLLNAALERGDKVRALTFARRGLEMHPRQPWLIDMTLQLETAARDFEAATKTLRRAERAGTIAPPDIRCTRVAIALFEAEKLARDGLQRQAMAKIKTAYDLDKTFVPAVQRLAEAYLADGNRRSAVSILERCWKVEPHPDLLELWIKAMPKVFAGRPPKMIGWSERLTRSNPDHPESLLAMAQVSAQARLWGEAREFLRKIETAGAADKRIYQLMMALDGETTESSASLALKAAEAQAPKSWICKQTSRLYGRWEPIAEPHGSFNTMIWERPGSFGFVEKPSVLKQIGVL